MDNKKDVLMKSVVLGLAFGDEGKGLTTDWLCSKAFNPLVVRFSGGHQAGHMVHHNGIRHVFSNFGSGTLRGVPTYWSKFCTVDPTAVLNELAVLRQNGIEPRLYIDPECPITTPFEKFVNRESLETNRHGTCGVGFGATIQREENHYHLRFKDLFYESVLNIKIKLIQQSYYCHTHFSQHEIDEIDAFKEDCFELTQFAKIGSSSMLNHYDVVFEGSQGLLLDKDAGFFPHVTRSNTNLTNVTELNPLISELHVYLVTRAYQTRHGNGPMTNENIPHNIKINPNDTNHDHPFQGKFRRSVLDLDLLKYAIDSDPFLASVHKTLVVTCLDHVEAQWILTEHGEVLKFDNEDRFIEKIQDALQINGRCIRVRSDRTDCI